MDLSLSKRGEYVVRSALALARAYPSGEPLKLRQVSGGMGVPRTFVSQILGDLVHAGLAVSSFGVRGGYRLARSPEEVTLLEVVEAGEGPLEGAECGLASSCPWRAGCPLLGTFSTATVGVRATLTGTTLAELVRDGWSVDAETVCPAGAAEVERAWRHGQTGDAGDLLAPTASRSSLSRADPRRLAEDVGEHPVELLGEGIAPGADRGPHGGDGEGGNVAEHDDQRRCHRSSQRDRQPAEHGPIVRLPPQEAVPSDQGPDEPRWDGAISGRPEPGGLPGDRSITVVIVDDHVLVREGSAQLLEAEPDIVVVGLAGTGEVGVDLIERLQPDVALVDINLPGMSGLELAREVRDRRIPTRVLVLSAYDDYGYVAEAVDVGVGGYLLKTASSQELVASLRLVVDGVTVLDRAVSARLRRRLAGTAPVPAASSKGVSLTPREADVLRLLADGRSNKEIGAALCLGLRTVESHVSSMLAKLGATSRTQAVALALRHQLVPGEHRPERLHGRPVERR